MEYITDLFIKSNDSSLNPDAIFTFALVILTAVLSWFTALMAKESKRKREPSVVICIEYSKTHAGLLCFSIENIGGGSAHNITITDQTNTKFKLLGSASDGVSLKEIGVLNPKILKPSQRIEHAFQYRENLNINAFEIFITYRDQYKKIYKSKSWIDIPIYENSLSIHSPEFEMAKSLKEISKNIKYLSSGFCRLKVDTYNSKDREKKEST